MIRIGRGTLTQPNGSNFLGTIPSITGSTTTWYVTLKKNRRLQLGSVCARNRVLTIVTIKCRFLMKSTTGIESPPLDIKKIIFQLGFGIRFVSVIRVYVMILRTYSCGLPQFKFSKLQIFKVCFAFMQISLF